MLEFCVLQHTYTYSSPWSIKHVNSSVQIWRHIQKHSDESQCTPCKNSPDRSQVHDWKVYWSM